jgi:hypothetical protein
MVLQCISILQFCDAQLSSSQQLTAVADVFHNFGLVAMVRKGRQAARTRDSGDSQQPVAAGFPTDEIPAPEVGMVPSSNVKPNSTIHDPYDEEVRAVLADIGVLPDWIAYYGGRCQHTRSRLRDVETVISLAASHVLGPEQCWMECIERFKPFATAETLWIMCCTEHVEDLSLYKFIEAMTEEAFPLVGSVHVKTQMAISILEAVEDASHKLTVSRLANHFVQNKRRRLSRGTLCSTSPTLAAAIAATRSASSS